MLNNITLTSSMRSNLYALKNLSTQMSTTQNRLASGLKVNSAIDNANSYYQARALNNRASDLDMLLDAMGQSIQTISTAVTGLEKAGETLEQAAVIAQEAYEAAIIPEKAWFEAQVGPNGAVVTSAQELKDAVNSGKETICVYGHIDLGEITTGLSLKNGQKLVGVGYFGDFDNSYSSIKASNNSGLNLVYTTKNNTVSNLNLLFEHEKSGYAITVRGGGNIIKDVSIKSYTTTDTAYNNFGGILIRETSNVDLYGDINIYVKSNRTDARAILNYGTLDIKSGATLNITSKNNALVNYTNNQSIGNINIENNVMINCNSPYLLLNHKVNGDTIGQINLAKDVILSQSNSYLRGIFKIDQNISIDTENTVTKISSLPNVAKISDEAIPLPDWDEVFNEDKSSYTEDTAQYIEQYATVMNSFDEIVEDSSYQGVNLLTGGVMTTMFNESRTHSMVVQGEDMRSSSLGITAREWNTRDDIAASIAEIKNAMGKVRDMVEKLGNNLSIIQTRENFTDAMIDVLQVGADNLVLADMNEESANYLALQTRNNLAVNALSLAAQAGSAVLKLF